MERIRQAVEQASRDRKANKARSEQRAQTGGPHAHAQAVPAGAVSLSELQYTQTRCIEVSPAVREDKKLVAAIPGHPLQDTYRMLRTRVYQELAEQNWNAIAVTSPSSGCGKSHMAINLAISLAMDVSHTVLLIDADLRRPSIHEYFGYKPKIGLNDYLDGDVPLSSVLFHPDIERLSVLPGREPINASAEALRSPKLKALLKEAKTRYSDRIIVLDIPPVLTVDDALSLAPSVDCMLMVVEHGLTKREDLHKALELLAAIPIIGTVLNKTNKKAAAAY